MLEAVNRYLDARVNGDVDAVFAATIPLPSHFSRPHREWLWNETCATRLGEARVIAFTADDDTVMAWADVSFMAESECEVGTLLQKWIRTRGEWRRLPDELFVN